MTTEQQGAFNERLDRAIVAANQMPLGAIPDVNEMLSRLPSQTSSESAVSPNATTGLRRRRSFVPTVAKLAVASAAAVFAALLVLNSPSQSAVAQVIAKVKSHRFVRCELQTSAKVKMKVQADREAEFVDADSYETVYFDLVSPRFRVDRIERTLNNTVDSQWSYIQDNQTNRVLVSSSIELAISERETDDPTQLMLIAEFRESGMEGKIARIFDLNDEGVKPFLHRNSERPLLEMLDQLQAQSDIDAVVDEINGERADKYTFEDGDDSITLWVDSQSQLPVRIEELRHNPHADAEFYKWTYSDFQWDDDDLDLELQFSTEPPEGYKVEDHIGS